jgi:hypothetical protein
VNKELVKENSMGARRQIVKNDNRSKKSYGKNSDKGVIKIPAIEKKPTGHKNYKTIVMAQDLSTPKSVGFPIIIPIGRGDSPEIKSPKKKYSAPASSLGISKPSPLSKNETQQSSKFF